MNSNDSEIAHVSDTALMVAACRALETAREDGLVRDPYAERLAGERGMAIARGLPRLEILCFGVGIRSRFLDELVMDAVEARQVKTILCLGAGLDTRPWRLALPADLRWIEVDFPALLEYKGQAMGEHRPTCRLEQMAADVNEAEQRAELFRAVGEGPALMMTEGLLMYLPGATVEGLAAEAATSGVRYWVLDVASREFASRVRMDANGSIERMRAPDHLEGEEILAAAMRNGWGEVRRRSYVRDAMEVAMERIRSIAKAAAATAVEPMAPPPPDDPSGVHLLGRRGEDR